MLSSFLFTNVTFKAFTNLKAFVLLSMVPNNLLIASLAFRNCTKASLSVFKPISYYLVKPLRALCFSPIFVLGAATGCCFFVLGAGIGVWLLPPLTVVLYNLSVEASLFGFSFQNWPLSLTKACAAKVSMLVTSY